jgi:hypothetical protein
MGSAHYQLSIAGQTTTCRKLKTTVNALADPTFLPNRIESLHRRRHAMILPRTSPRPLLVERVLVVFVDADLPLLMHRDNERSPRRAPFRGTRS